MKPAIRVENLSKAYRIGHQAKGGYRTLRESLSNSMAHMGQRLMQMFTPTEAQVDGDVETFWALKDVSFEVQPGEVVGTIGRNGAGKSTLLKILSRITEPTAGRGEIHGRMGSLLEVGTGFHPELTGRENIFLNGSILGMRRNEIVRKFDEIVAFSEIEQFLDTPVKRYSSGMYVRLAFAVAAHLEPEILVVDEVLAVGDAEFQKKCIGKMSEVSKNGRTVIFVSHNMGAIQRLCTRVIYFEKGRLTEDGSVETSIARYMQSGANALSNGEWISLKDVERRGTGQATFESIRCRGCEPEGTGGIVADGSVDIQFEIDSDRARTVSSMAITFYDRYGTKLVNADTISLGHSIALCQGRSVVNMRIQRLHLNPGIYVVGLWLANQPVVYDHIESAITLEIHELTKQSLGKRPNSDGLVTCSFSVDAENRRPADSNMAFAGRPDCDVVV